MAVKGVFVGFIYCWLSEIPDQPVLLSAIKHFVTLIAFQLGNDFAVWFSWL